MNVLREALVFKDAIMGNLIRTPLKDDGVSWVQHVHGPMTIAMADIIGVRAQCYNLNDNPFPATEVTKKIDWPETELSVPGFKLLRPSLVTGFHVKPSKLAGANGALDLNFRMVFQNAAPSVGDALNELNNKVGSNPFDLSIISLQGTLFAVPSKEDGPAGGTQVEMGINTGEEPEGDGQEEPPPLVKAAMDGDTQAVAEGIAMATSEEPIDAGTLPSHRAMAGGTHANAKKARGHRRAN